MNGRARAADVTAYVIERARGYHIARLLQELKALKLRGWNVTALLSPDGSVIGLGYVDEEISDLAQLALFAEASA